MGTLGSTTLGFFFALFATTGVILAAVYILYMFQRVFMGELVSEENRNLEPLHWTEYASLIPITIVAILIGIQPFIFFHPMDASVGQLVAQVQPYVTTVVQLLP